MDEVVLAGALAALVGVHVVLRRLSFFTMALTHATFPGVVAASIVGVNLVLGGVVAGAVVALGVAALSRRRGQDAAAATGVLLSAGFALGAALVATQSGVSRDLSSFLVGSILTVDGGDVLTAAVVLVVVSVVLTAGARPLLQIGFDRTGGTDKRRECLGERKADDRQRTLPGRRLEPAGRERFPLRRNDEVLAVDEGAVDVEDQEVHGQFNRRDRLTPRALPRSGRNATCRGREARSFGSYGRGAAR